MRRPYCYYFLLFSHFIFTFGSAQNLSFNSLPSPALESVSTPNYFESDLAFETGIAKLNRETPIDLQYNSEVRTYIELFLGKRRSDMELSLTRAQYYFPIFEEVLDRYNLPLELKYIAVIESGLNPFACSKSGAVGLWQFLYNTCSLFDLKVDSYIDERRDVYKSTEAACRYLQYLYLTFRDWNLVLAGYVGGPGEVRKAIERSGGKTDYWEIRPYLAPQVKNYIPAFIAVDYLMNNYAMHGINLKPGEYPVKTDTLHITYAVYFEQITKVLDISIGELVKLNPVYRRHYIPQLQEPSVLVLPEPLITKYLREEKFIREVKIPEDNYSSLLARAGDVSDKIKIFHTVQPGEYFHKIALRYNCTIENIKAWNGLSSMVIHPGQVLEIWVDE